MIKISEIINTNKLIAITNFGKEKVRDYYELKTLLISFDEEDAFHKLHEKPSRIFHCTLNLSI